MGLGEIADNLWWSWHPAARMFFKMLDRPAWKESVHNPVKMLRELPRKECSDFGVPIMAVGFMYPEGHVRQKIHEDDRQEGTDEPIDRDAAPIARVLDEKGEQLVVRVPFIEPPIHKGGHHGKFVLT